MKARDHKSNSREIIESYMEQINWDWLFLKGQLIFGGIMFLGLTIFLYWLAG